MTKIKLCGLSRSCDIKVANRLQPDYVGFVFAKNSRRYVSPQIAMELKDLLSPDIQKVGVFVNEEPEYIERLLKEGVIDIAQLHGAEDESYIQRLRALTDRPIIKAFQIFHARDAQEAQKSTADMILVDSGAGTGSVFDWELIQSLNRPYFLAGGLSPQNVEYAIRVLHPYGVDVSSGIETEKYKDPHKMSAFVAAVRKGDEGS